MAVIDPVKFGKAKPLISEVIRKLFSPGEDWVASMDRVIEALRDGGLTDSAEAEMAPYLSLYVQEA